MLGLSAANNSNEQAKPSGVPVLFQCRSIRLLFQRVFFVHVRACLVEV